MIHSKRKFKNFLLLPSLQIKFGLYVIALTIVLLISLAGVIVGEFGETAYLIIQLTDVENEVKAVINDTVHSLYWIAATAIVLYMILILGLSIIYTHRLIGPTKAFKRHIESLLMGNYHAKTYLRKGDAFSDVAAELNKLSNYLKNQELLDQENSE